MSSAAIQPSASCFSRACARSCCRLSLWVGSACSSTLAPIAIIPTRRLWPAPALVRLGTRRQVGGGETLGGPAERRESHLPFRVGGAEAGVEEEIVASVREVQPGAMSRCEETLLRSRPDHEIVFAIGDVAQLTLSRPRPERRRRRSRRSSRRCRDRRASPAARRDRRLGPRPCASAPNGCAQSIPGIVFQGMTRDGS